MAPSLGSTTSMIEIRGVGKHFQQRKGSLNVVLENIDLTIRKGEFVSLVGQSGCGKTTLLRMIAGLAPYSPGEIRVNGKAVRSVPPRIGFVFQNAALLPWKTVNENVMLGLNETRSAFTREEKRAKVQHQLELTGLAKFGDYLPGQLSGGMQQRCGLARALVGEPDVLLMDEPFGAVDALTRIRLQEELSMIVERTEATVVFVTHDVEEAVFLADRVAVMTTGPGTIKEVVDVDLPRPRERRSEVISPLSDYVLELVLGGGERRKVSPPEAVEA
jgi:ABC-type nitrate/sulfonate/bicarbonate transport system ATPase subunit